MCPFTTKEKRSKSIKFSTSKANPNPKNKTIFFWNIWNIMIISCKLHMDIGNYFCIEENLCVSTGLIWQNQDEKKGNGNGNRGIKIGFWDLVLCVCILWVSYLFVIIFVYTIFYIYSGLPKRSTFCF